MEEVEKHNTAGDLWIAVEGSVFDMTKCVQPLNFSSFWTFLLLLLLFLTFFLFFFFFLFFLLLFFVQVPPQPPRLRWPRNHS